MRFLLTGLLLVFFLSPSSSSEAAPQVVQAKQSDSLADFTGVNVHELGDTSQYNLIFKPRLREARIRYIRGDMLNMQEWKLNRMVELSNPTDGSPPIKYLGISPYRSEYVGSALNECFKDLITTMVTGGVLPCGPSQGRSVNGTVKFAGIEGPNEADHCVSNNSVCQPLLPPNPSWWQDAEANNPNWIADTENTVINLWTKLKSDARTRNIPILAPTFVHVGEYKTNPYPPYGDLYARLQQLNQYYDYGNAHVYCGNKQFSLTCFNSYYDKVRDFTQKPVQITETGYHTATGYTNAVSEIVQEKYGMRTLLTLFDAGVKNAYLYQLVDDSSGPSYGIVRVDGSPKPLFNSIKNLNLLLDDRGPSFSAGKLSFALEGDVSGVKSTLVQKRSGEYFILLRYDAAVSTDTIVNKSITVSLGETASSAEVYDLTSPNPTKRTTATKSIALEVPDRVVAVRVVPAIAVTQSNTNAPSSGKTGTSKPSQQPPAAAVPGQADSTSEPSGFMLEKHTATKQESLPREFIWIAALVLLLVTSLGGYRIFRVVQSYKLGKDNREPDGI